MLACLAVAPVSMTESVVEASITVNGTENASFCDPERTAYFERSSAPGVPATTGKRNAWMPDR